MGLVGFVCLSFLLSVKEKVRRKKRNSYMRSFAHRPNKWYVGASNFEADLHTNKMPSTWNRIKLYLEGGDKTCVSTRSGAAGKPWNGWTWKKRCLCVANFEDRFAYKHNTPNLKLQPAAPWGRWVNVHEHVFWHRRPNFKTVNYVRRRKWQRPNFKIWKGGELWSLN